MIKVMQADITTDIAQSESRSGAMKNLAVSFMLSEALYGEIMAAADCLDFKTAAERE